MKKRTVKQDHAKLKELILYVAEKCQFRPNFGATMLNKILFFSDFLAYARFGQSITEEEYFKLERGPAPRYLVPVREGMIGEGLIIVQTNRTMKGEQKRIVPTGKRESNLEVFESRHISLVDEVIEKVKQEDAESVSDLSHKFYGWQITKDRETIPYATVFLKEPKPRPTPKAVCERIEKLIKEYGKRQATSGSPQKTGSKGRLSKELQSIPKKIPSV